MSSLKHFVALIAVACFVAAAGCKPDTPAPQNTSSTGSNETPHEHDGDDEAHAEGEHAHGAGPHGGAVADWGGGKYHVEFTVDHDKKETIVYVLGSDEKTPAPIKAADGKLLLSIAEPSFQVELTADPLDGETDGASSRYVGHDDRLGVVQEFDGTISGEDEGTPYSGDFKEEPPTDE